MLWLDAHGDFNSPDTTPSGFLGGMCLAGGCGVWETGFEGGFPAERVVLCGVRDLDEGERKLVDASGATVIGPQVETLVYLQNALDGEPVYVHLDVDVLDPSIMPAQFPAPGGLTDEKLRDLHRGGRRRLARSWASRSPPSRRRRTTPSASGSRRWSPTPSSRSSRRERTADGD